MERVYLPIKFIDPSAGPEPKPMNAVQKAERGGKKKASAPPPSDFEDELESLIANKKLKKKDVVEYFKRRAEAMDD